VSTQADRTADTGADQIPVRRVSTEQVWQWLAAGWNDFGQAPVQSLFYGISLTLLSLLISYAVIATGDFHLLPPLLAGFLLIAPFFGIGPYSISQQLEQGDGAKLKTACLACIRNTLQIFNMGLVLLACFVVWALLANLVFYSFYDGPIPADWLGFVAILLGSWEGLQILAVGTLVGGALALLVFSLSAVSIPMLMDRPVNVFTAIRTSSAAVRANIVPMLLWGGILVAIIGFGVLTAYLGFIVGFPVAAYSTWHAYRGLVPSQD